MSRVDTLIGAIDGVNTTFTTPSNFQSGSFRLIWDGIIYPPDDAVYGYSETGSQTIQTVTAPTVGTVLQGLYEIGTTIIAGGGTAGGHEDGITLKIAVPNISVVIAAYNVIRVFRSSSTRDGPFVELTNTTAQPASMTGTVAGPFTSLNGKTLILRVHTNTGPRPDLSVTFTDPDPVSIGQVVTAINTAMAGVVLAVDNGSSQLKISTVYTGMNAVLEVVGGTAIADLGLGLYQRDTGEDPFLPLVATDNVYEFYDPQGNDVYWYRWQFYNTGTLASSALSEAVQPQAARIDPVRRIEDFRATRGLTLVRSREHTFRMEFWENQAQQIPLVPLDAGRYPAYTIYDPTGLAVQTGVASIDGAAPHYKVLFTPGLDATLTNDDRRWRIDWFFVTDTNRPVQTSEIFDMRDVDVTESEIVEYKTLALEGATKRLHIATQKRPVSISMQLENANDTTNVILPLPAVFPPSGPNPSLTELQDGDRYVYYYDVPPNNPPTFEGMVAGSNGNTYQAIWTILETPISEEQHEFQILEVPPRSALQYFPGLRMVVDKFQKNRRAIQAYQDSDVFEYLKRGLQLVNSTNPVHLSWTMTGVPSSIQPYWLLAATVWGLNAQHLLETDLQFSHSGQTVTLDYDRTAGIDAGISRALDLLGGGSANGALGLPAAKMQLYRKNSPVGSFAGRPTRRTGINNWVFPISRDSGGTGMDGNSYLALLNKVGLL